MENNSDKIILDLCGGSGAWSKPYKDAGYDVRLITLPEHDVLEWPLVLARMRIEPEDIYGILAAPPCTVFSKANWRDKKSDRDFEEGMKVVRACLDCIWWVQEHGAGLKFWALENPMGYLYNFLGRPVFFFQPWKFGETGTLATKRVALWGYFNQPATTVRKRKVPYVRTHSKNRDAKSHAIEINRQWGNMPAHKRAVTSEKFAKAFMEANR